MKKIKKIAVGIIALALAVVTLLFVAVLIVPKLVDTKMVKKMVRVELAEKFGAEVDFDRVDIFIFPIPHVRIYTAKFTLPEKFEISAETIKVYPEILPLLSLKMHIKELFIQRTDMVITLKKAPEKNKTREKPASISELAHIAVSIVTELPEFKLFGITYRLENGNIKVVYENRQVFELHDVQAHTTALTNKVKFEIEGASVVGKTVSMSGWVNSRQMKGSARILLTQLQPRLVSSVLFPESLLKIQDGLADVAIDFDIDGPGHIQADIALSMPQLKLAREEEAVEIRNVGLKCRNILNKNLVSVLLTELVLGSPKMHLSGHLISAVDDPQMRLQLEGRDIDLTATRQAILALSGENSVTPHIFQVVKGGRVPLVTLEARGRAWGDLANTDSLVVRGRMHDGEIHIPGVRLDLADASGDVVISHGMLEGENLKARLGNSSGQNGKLKLGPTGDVTPIHLETDVRADLSQLLPVLNGLLDDKSKLALPKKLEGSANGKLVLVGDTENVKVKLDASDIHLTARYDKIPFPVEITRGNVTYEENQINVGQLSGRLGKSSFSGLTGGVKLGKKHHLEIESGKSQIFSTEILSWLSSYEKMRGFHKSHSGGKSIIGLSAITLKGPLSNPENWHFNVSGDVEDLVLKNLPGVPKPVTIALATFTADPNTFTYKGASMTMLDAALNISGTHTHYLEGFEKNGSLTMEGRLGPQSLKWASDFSHLPPLLKLRPITISRSHLTWDERGQTTFSGFLGLKGGLDISVDIIHNPDQLIVKKLLVQDESSRANVGLKVNSGAFDLSFSGNLHKPTLDKLVRENRILAGWIQGNARVRATPPHLSNLSLKGKIKGEGLFVPLGSKTQLKTGAFSVTGDEHKIFVESADLIFNDMQVNMSGTVKPYSQNRLWLDMDMAAHLVDLDRLIQTVEQSRRKKDRKTVTASPSLPVQGSIRFKAERFIFNGFTWKPLHADIVIRKDTAAVTFKEAMICGISTPGTLKVSPQGIEFDLKPRAKGRQLDHSLNCFGDKSYKADGKYDLMGKFAGRGKAKDILNTSTGHVELTVADGGRIYHDIVLLNVLKYLNAVEFLEGRTDLNEMEKKGFNYHSFRVNADLQNGKIIIKEFVLNGAPMIITGAGEHNLQNGGLDLTLLVAPLARLDRVLDHIPLIGGMLHTLDTIPIGLRGTLDNVRIYPLAPSAIGYELKELMKNTFNRPIKLRHGGRTPVENP